MYQSRIVKNVQNLTQKEKERFQHFVNSPYLNQHSKTQELLDLILKALENPKLSLDRKYIFKKLFPKDTFDEQKLHNIQSYLKKLFHRFLAFEHLESLDYHEQLLTVESSFANNRFDLLKNRAKQLEKSLSKHPYHDSNYYYVNYRLQNLLGYYSGHYEDRARTVTFNKMLSSLDKFYIIEKLKNCCHLTANMMLINTKYEFLFLEELLLFIKEHWEEFYTNDLSIILYYTILLSLREEENTAHYLQLKEMVASKINYLSPDEKGDLYTFTYNYCIVKINAGNSEYRRELFQLYKQGLKSGMLLVKGILSEWNYKNITTLGCNLEEFEWTEDFIQEYKDMLPAHRKDNAYNYNLAYLYCEKRLYNEALSVLLHVQFTDIKYHLSTSFLLLRTYYELKDTEALLSLIETFRIYVIRNRKMTTDQKRSYTNFLRFAKKLVLLKHHSSTYSKKGLEEKLGNLKSKIESTSNVINRVWLLEECQVQPISQEVS